MKFPVILFVLASSPVISDDFVCVLVYTNYVSLCGSLRSCYIRMMIKFNLMGVRDGPYAERYATLEMSTDRWPLQ